MTYIRNVWYVVAWTTEMEDGKPLGRTVIEEPVVIWRGADGDLVAMEDRCPHRHAPLSLGRLDGDEIQCMYHGLKFSKQGSCTHVPGTDITPPNCEVKTYPVAEKHDWIWVWMGDPSLADESLIPDAYGLDNDLYLQSNGDALDYEANYQLIHDNLLDLSHADFVHETTLGKMSGHYWSKTSYDIKILSNGLQFGRWMTSSIYPGKPALVNTWNTYKFLLPGLFLQEAAVYPPGAAEECDFKEPNEDSPVEPYFVRIDQQAVTPINESQSRYLFASGLPRKYIGKAPDNDGAMAIIHDAFLEDRVMIEAQQKIWQLTPLDKRKAFIPFDKAPNMFRKMIKRRIQDEA